MSTPDTVKAQLQAVLQSANNKTGKNDGDITAAVASLIAGFGSGGGDSGGNTGGVTIQSGSFTPAENILEYTIPVDGTVSNFVMRKKTDGGGYGVRFLFGIEVLQTYATPICLGSNSGGTSVNSVATIHKPLTFEDGFVRIHLSASTAGLGYLVPEQYNWIAW